MGVGDSGGVEVGVSVGVLVADKLTVAVVEGVCVGVCEIVGVGVGVSVIWKLEDCKNSTIVLIGKFKDMLIWSAVKLAEEYSHNIAYF